MSFNDGSFVFQNYNFAVDTAWNESVSSSSIPVPTPSGSMEYLNNAEMTYLSGDRMVYLET